MLSRQNIRDRKRDDEDAEDAAWDVVLDLPRPPSVNRLSAHRGNKTKCVQGWISEADYHLCVARNLRRIVPVRGPFEVEMIFARPAANRRFDLDNPIKVLLDWLHRVELTDDDALCDDIHATWGRAPLGVKVRLRAA